MASDKTAQTHLEHNNPHISANDSQDSPLDQARNDAYGPKTTEPEKMLESQRLREECHKINTQLRNTPNTRIVTLSKARPEEDLNEMTSEYLSYQIQALGYRPNAISHFHGDHVHIGIIGPSSKRGNITDKQVATAFEVVSLEELREALQEREREFAAHDLGLPLNSSWKEIDAARLEGERKHQAQALNLPETTAWDKIEEIAAEKARKETALKEGLPQDTSWDKIEDARIEREERERQAAAQDLGLPINTPWAKIHKIRDENARKEAALKLGLPATAAWNEILTEESKRSPKEEY